MRQSLLAALLPIVGFAVGSWVGLRSLDARPVPKSVSNPTALFALTGALEPAGFAPRFARAGEPPPLEEEPPDTETSELTEIPRLNPDANVQRAWLLAEGPARPLDNRGRRLVTFTFDDGPFPETTPMVLKILARHHIRATFFLIGQYLEGKTHRAHETRKLARQILEAGHIVGNHTHDHALLTSLSRPKALAQIDEGAAAIQRATGQYPHFFRPPFGALDPYLENAAKERKLELVLWNVAVEDMVRDDYEELLADLRGRLEYSGGGIVLLHDIRWSSVKAFNRLVYWLEAHRYNPAKPDTPGYEIVDLFEYMRATAGAPQPYENREHLEMARKAARTGVL